MGITEPANDTNTLQTSIYSDSVYSAVFVAVSPPKTKYTMVASVSPTGSGTATISPAGPYIAGTDVLLEATSDNGYLFNHWVINGVTYITNVVAVSTPANDSTAVAYFVENTTGSYQLAVSVVPLAGGSFTQSNYGPFVAGSQVTLKAIPAKGYAFAYWTINGNKVNSASVILTMEGNGIAIATFTQSKGLLSNMSTTTKVILVAGGAIVIGSIVFLLTGKKKVK
jgi:hypothetical protein